MSWVCLLSFLVETEIYKISKTPNVTDDICALHSISVPYLYFSALHSVGFCLQTGEFHYCLRLLCVASLVVVRSFPLVGWVIWNPQLTANGVFAMDGTIQVRLWVQISSWKESSWVAQRKSLSDLSPGTHGRTASLALLLNLATFSVCAEASSLWHNTSQRDRNTITHVLLWHTNTSADTVKSELLPVYEL